MTKTNSVVEVNGNRYDAVSGRLLSSVHKPSVHSPATGKRVVDGFTLGAHHVSKKTPHKTAAKTIHAAPQRSQTLMRHAVKKPAGSNGSLHPKMAAAKKIQRHEKVNRFGHLAERKSDSPSPAVLPVKARPIDKSQPIDYAPQMPSMVTSASHKELEDILDDALMRADAHKQMMNPHRRHARKLHVLPRWLALSLLIFTVIGVGSAVAWKKLPAVSVQMASMRAHVKASLPSYTPSGFTFSGPPSYTNGAISMKYKDKLSSESFVITQKNSSWDSSSLASNSLVKESSVQTSQVNGTTVYIYGTDGDATWVNNGMLYSLKNQARLSSDQVLRIVQGL